MNSESISPQFSLKRAVPDETINGKQLTVDTELENLQRETFMPLCWSHAEYVTLVRSHQDGVCFDRIEPVYQRYAKAGTGSKIEMWTFAHQTQHIEPGKILRIITEAAATIHWSFDGWATANDLEMHDAGFGCWFGDLPSDRLETGSRIVFTFLWRERWEGKDFQVGIDASVPIRKAA